MSARETAWRPRLAQGVRLREDPVRGRTVLLAPERILETSPSAVAILQLCDGSRDLQAIADELAARFTGDADRIAEDVRNLLADLAAKRLVEL